MRIGINSDSMWHKMRLPHLQGTDGPAILGLSPWKTADDVYNIKTGLMEEPDISYKPYVRFGKEAEQYIRALVALDFPKMKVGYARYDIFESDDYPFMGATLDGMLKDTETNTYGILEIKTGSFTGAKSLEPWNGKIPVYYYAQVLHQLACVKNASFTIVAARLKRDPFKEEDNGLPEIVWRYYRYERKDVEPEIEWLVKKEEEFWGYVQRRERPPMKVNPNAIKGGFLS